MSIEVTDNGFYVVRGRGVIRRYASLSEAIAVRDILKDLGYAGEERVGNDSAHTFEYWAELWWEYLVDNDYSPNTLRGYKSNLRKHVFPVFAERYPHEIRVDEWELLFSSIDGSARRFNVTRAVSAFYAYLVDEGVVEENPIRKIKKALSFKAKRERVALTPRQVFDLYLAMEERYRISILLGAYMGLRFGEMAGLQRQDIDLDNEEMHVRRALKRSEGGGMLGAPKTKAGVRTLAIPSQIMPALRTYLKSDYCEDFPTAPIIPASRNPSDPIAHTTFNNKFNEARKKAGLGNVTFHELRHTHLTWYGRTGATNADLMSRGGHEDADTVMVYQHASIKRQKELANKLPELPTR
ncbi:MAG: site-specific integrase [Actinomycetaceae bacterium]|nr:site-specific integrase [Actinomycetaceae bacterium]